MNNHPVLQYLKPHYFWDVDISGLDFHANKQLIINRVVTLGSFKEIMLIVDLFGKDGFINEVKKINLDPKTLNFISRVFNIPKTEFICYTRMSSTPRHWNL